MHDMTTVDTMFYEDIRLGDVLISPAESINRDEMVTFASKWDPLPIHVDEAAGIETFGSLTAPGLFVLAVKLRLIHRSKPVAVIASLGYDEIRFHAPLRPDDTVVLEQRWLSRRLSNSKQDRGIVTVHYSLINQAGTVMTHLDTLLVRRRNIGSAGTTP